MIARFLIISLLMLSSIVGLPQTTTIKVDVRDQPLNVVLLQLRNQYDFQFSYSDNELSKFKITVSKSFNSKEEAIRFLLKDLPFQLKITDKVFIIVPDKKKPKVEEKKKEITLFSGQIVEAGSFEPLPFSHILVNNHPLVSDVKGSFNYTASADSSFRVRISHLGYYVQDTVVYAGNFHQFKLVPSTERLAEVVVKTNLVEKATMVGNKPGQISLNQTISRFLPGQGDNAVFNLLRLLPGIQAAGEQSTDLLIWGSYEGHSLVTFDEFSIFGLKNYNDNISVVNPFLVKNIEVLKGGFDARYGNRVGGIVNITGKNGSLGKPVFSFNINPTTINAMAEVPLFKKSSVLMAYRQTYYNLYNSDDFNIFAPTKPPKNKSTLALESEVKPDINVYPNDYQFRDFNFKYSYSPGNGDQFYVSFYTGGDLFSLKAEADIERKIKGSNTPQVSTPLTVLLTNNEKNKQRGLSVFYAKNWTERLMTKLVLTHADFSKQITDSLFTQKQTDKLIFKKEQTGTENSAVESALKIDNVYNLIEGNQLEFGGGIFRHEAIIDFNTNFKDTLKVGSYTQFINRRAMAYVQDNWPIGSRLVLKGGIRFNLSNNIVRLHLEPRLTASYKLTEAVKLNGAWGRYNQFMYKMATVDRDNNYTYLWMASNKNTAVLNATHWLAGATYSANQLVVNVEGYYKFTRNIVQRVFEERRVDQRLEPNYYINLGNARTYGMDVYARKDFGKQSVWASYTLSVAQEQWYAFNTRKLSEFAYAPHHQLHEFKVAALFNVGNFYLSTDYVYGSGMQLLQEVFANQDVSYNRVDAALTYKFSPRKLSGEVGLSVLNIFDTQNLKYANLKNIKLSPDLGNIRVYSNAVPFTPVLFLKLVF